MLGNSFSRDLREQLMDDCAYALGELYSSGCLFLVEGDSDQKVYQAVIDFILGKPGGPLRISALSPKESYLEGIDYLFFSCYREYSISPEPAVDLLKNGKEGRCYDSCCCFSFTFWEQTKLFWNR